MGRGKWIALAITVAIAILYLLDRSDRMLATKTPAAELIDARPKAPDEGGELFTAVDSAEYRLLSHRLLKNGHVEALTRRSGKSGISYALREFRCEQGDFRYLAEGGSAQEAREKPSSEDKFGALVRGSSSSNAAEAACKRYGKSVAFRS